MIPCRSASLYFLWGVVGLRTPLIRRSLRDIDNTGTTDNAIDCVAIDCDDVDGTVAINRAPLKIQFSKLG